MRTVLRRLEAQGFLNHRIDGKTFVYEARLSRQRVAATGVRQIIDRVCAGSVEQFLTDLVAEQVLSSAQMAELSPAPGPTSSPEKPKNRKKEKKRKKRDKRRATK